MLFSGGTTTIDGTYNAFSTTVNGGTANLLGTIAGLGATNISGGTLNVESLNGTIAAFTQTGSSTLTGTGTLKLTNAASLGTTSGGYLEENGSGTTDLQAGGTLGGSSSTPYLALDGGHVLQNDGTFNWVNGYIYLGYDPLATTVGGGTIVNSAGATFNDAVASSIFNETGSTVFDNAGTFATSFASGTTTIGVVFDNSGKVQVGSGGTLDLDGGGNSTGGSFSGGGTLELGASYTLNASSSISTANVIFAGALITLNGADNATNTTLSSGTLSLGSNSVTLATNFTQVGSSTLTGTGTLKLTNAASLGTTGGGYLEENGSGTTDLQAGGTLGGSSSTPYLALDGGHVLQNDGTFNWVNGYIYLGYDPLAPTVGGGTIVNSAGATFNDAVASSIITETGSTAFDNAGTFATSFASGTTTIGVVFDNSGKVQVGSGGTLDLDGGGNSTGGSFGGGGTLEFGASYTLNASSSISTANVIFAGALITLNGADTATNTTLSSGTLSLGSNSVTLATNFTQVGSSTLTGTGMLKLTNAASLGTTGGGYLEENGSGTTDLQAGGTLGGSSSTPYLALDGGHVLQNDGTFNWVNGYIYLGTTRLPPLSAAAPSSTRPVRPSTTRWRVR